VRRLGAIRGLSRRFEKKTRAIAGTAQACCKGHAIRLRSSHVTDRAEAQSNEPISWADAQEEAGKWIGELHLPRNLDGQTIDLTEHAKTLKFDGRFRRMILDAAERKLKKRGARVIILPPE